MPAPIGSEEGALLNDHAGPQKVNLAASVFSLFLVGCSASPRLDSASASTSSGWSWRTILSRSDNKQDYRVDLGNLRCVKLIQDYAATPYEPRRTTDNMHRGIDLGGAVGTPIIAAADGKVVSVTDDYHCAGKAVIIAHGKSSDLDHLFSYYFHLDDYIVSTGDQVRRGQQIGHLGFTGTRLCRGDQPHLHFATRTNRTGNYTLGDDMEVADTAWLAHRNPHQYWTGTDQSSRTATVELPGAHSGRDQLFARLTSPIRCQD